MNIIKATASTQGLGHVVQIQHPSVQLSVHRLAAHITASLVCFLYVIGDFFYL